MTFKSVSALIIPGLVSGYLPQFSNLKGKLGSKIDLLNLYQIAYALEQYYHEDLHVFPNWRHIQDK